MDSELLLSSNNVETYRLGTLAYVDTFGGLVPCKVVNATGQGHVTVRITATRRGYLKGERLTFTDDRVVPRDRIRTRSGQEIVRTGWRYDSI